jgi:hypothetical protein
MSEQIRLDRTKIEAICDAAQLRLEKRLRVENYELFIAAGESKPPHFRYQRFGVEPTEFPLGCFVTIWWLMKDEDKLVVAVPAFYEKNHEAYLTDEGRLKARVNRCAQEAVAFLESRKRARKGLKLHA